MIVTLYQWELFKKIAYLGTFCTQHVKEGLKVYTPNGNIRNYDLLTFQLFEMYVWASFFFLNALFIA
jgi:hypothetical protein